MLFIFKPRWQYFHHCSRFVLMKLRKLKLKHKQPDVTDGITCISLLRFLPSVITEESLCLCIFHTNTYFSRRLHLEAALEWEKWSWCPQNKEDTSHQSTHTEERRWQGVWLQSKWKPSPGKFTSWGAWCPLGSSKVHGKRQKISTALPVTRLPKWIQRLRIFTLKSKDVYFNLPQTRLMQISCSLKISGTEKKQLAKLNRAKLKCREW